MPEIRSCLSYPARGAARTALDRPPLCPPRERDISYRSGARKPMALPADLGYEDSCRKVVEEVASAHGGRIDILGNNTAEQHERGSITEISESDLDRVFRTNIFSYFLATKHAVTRMGHGGSIMNTASVNAYKGHKTLLDYTPTKGAIVSFTRALALQLTEKGIRVNGVAPGAIWTPLIPASFGKEKVEQFGSEVPTKRAGQPAEVAPNCGELGPPPPPPEAPPSHPLAMPPARDADRGSAGEEPAKLLRPPPPKLLCQSRTPARTSSSARRRQSRTSTRRARAEFLRLPAAKAPPPKPQVRPRRAPPPKPHLRTPRSPPAKAAPPHAKSAPTASREVVHGDGGARS